MDGIDLSKQVLVFASISNDAGPGDKSGAGFQCQLHELSNLPDKLTIGF